MTSILTGLGLALWLGIQTAISPCTLATNAAAVSFVSRRIGRPSQVFLSGILYALGRALTYTVIGTLLAAGLANASFISFGLERWMTRLLGPLLLVAALLISGCIPLAQRGSGMAQWLQDHADRLGIGGAGLLGILFALSFCPISAGLFFMTLIPLSIEAGHPVLFPLAFGLGTALPVVIIATVLAFGIGSLANLFQRLKVVEIWARRITVVVLALIGIYFTLRYTLP